VSSGVNKVILLGHLGSDAEMRYGQSGDAVCRMRLAATEKYKDRNGELQERTEWATVVLFGKRAEGLNKYLTKGSRLYVEGRMQTRQWEDKEGGKRTTTEVIATEIVLLGGNNGQRTESREQHRTTDTRKPESEDTFGDDGDDIPFDRVRMGMCE
jgi:single-strand DNA-binding protein